MPGPKAKLTTPVYVVQPVRREHEHKMYRENAVAVAETKKRNVPKTKPAF